MEELKDEAYILSADGGERGVTQSGRACAIDVNRAGCGEVHRTGEVEESGFAAATASDDGEEFAMLGVERYTVERNHVLVVGAIVFCDVVEAQQRHGGTRETFDGRGSVSSLSKGAGYFVFWRPTRGEVA